MSSNYFIEVLKWAAGSTETHSLPRPPAGAEEYSKLLKVIWTNKMGQRVSNTLDSLGSNEAAGWSAVREDLALSNQTDRDRFEKSLHQVSEMQANVSERSSFLQVKGSTVHLTSGGIIPLRRSADIDILIDDLPVFSKELLSLGYQRSPYSPAPHELGGWSRDAEELHIDLHSYIAARRFNFNPPAILSRDQGRLTLLLELEAEGSRTLAYQLELAELNGHRAEMELNYLPLVNREMAAVISLLHMHRDYVGTWSNRESGTMLLAELADLADLFRLDFDFAAFELIVQRTHAAQSLVFVRDMLKAILDVSIPEIDMMTREMRSVFGRQLWWDAESPIYWVEEEPIESPDELIVADLSFADFIQHMYAYAAERSDDREPVSELVLRTSAESIGADISAGLGRDGITARFTIPLGASLDRSPLAQDQVIALVNLGEVILEVNYWPSTGKVESFDHMTGGRYGPELSPSVAVSCESGAADVKIVAQIPVSYFRGTDTVGCILAAGSRETSTAVPRMGLAPVLLSLGQQVSVCV